MRWNHADEYRGRYTRGSTGSLMQHIFRVAEITRALKDVVEGQFPFVWVKGQVSNLARPASGHVYFSLKDEEALLNVVWFKGSQRGVALGEAERYDPLTGEVLEGDGGSGWLADGMEVLCAGRLTVYAPRGAYQLVAEYVQDMGLGKLALEFEALKRKLQEAGYFAQERKRPLPHNPVRVAVVTAATGAAIQDFLRVGSARGTGCEIRIHPVLVQGEAAPGQIGAALDAAGSDGWAQVTVLIRGGGSLEDLWAFNTEPVAHAVYRSPIPVLCGVGHEVDVTIADLVADVRAATPSHAAQVLWPERAVLAQRADELETALTRAFGRRLQAAGDRLGTLEKALAWLSPRGRVERMGEKLDDLSMRLLRAGAGLPLRRGEALDGLERRLWAFGAPRLAGFEGRLESLRQRLAAVGQRSLERADSRLTLLEAHLRGLDPELPLERGYSLVRRADGSFLRSTADAHPGDALEIRVRDGSVAARVTGVHRREP